MVWSPSSLLKWNDLIMWDRERAKKSSCEWNRNWIYGLINDLTRCRYVVDMCNRINMWALSNWAFLSTACTWIHTLVDCIRKSNNKFAVEVCVTIPFFLRRNGIHIWSANGMVTRHIGTIISRYPMLMEDDFEYSFVVCEIKDRERERGKIWIESTQTIYQC